MSEEVSVAMGTPIEGFFDGAGIMVEAMASASTTVQEAPTDAPIPSPRLGPIEESAQTERVGEFVPIPVETPIP